MNIIKMCFSPFSIFIATSHEFSVTFKTQMEGVTHYSLQSQFFSLHHPWQKHDLQQIWRNLKPLCRPAAAALNDKFKMRNEFVN